MKIKKSQESGYYIFVKSNTSRKSKQRKRVYLEIRVNKVDHFHADVLLSFKKKPLRQHKMFNFQLTKETKLLSKLEQFY